ncbi:MAG TPA: FAD-dependent oxidoreductase [Steroidobacteraceae bacterium]
MATDDPKEEDAILSGAPRGMPPVARREQMFPKLTAKQIARLEPHGEHIELRAGEILAQPGDRHLPLLVVLSGSIEVAQVGLAGAQLVVLHEAGSFSGELSTLRGVGSVVRMRVRSEGTALSISDSALRDVIQTDSELSELFMRAFILRRVALITSASGDVILLGSSSSASTLRLQQFLTRNTFPFVSLDVASDSAAKELRQRFQIADSDLPVVLCRGEVVIKNPSNEEVAACLGMNPQIDDSRVRDLIVVGAGPSGLAAAVYGASEGLDVLVLETGTPGGQAGSSSKIENYLGFPTGISGLALASRALVQAQKFGAEIRTAYTAYHLDCDTRPYSIRLADGKAVQAKCIIIATGAEYRQLTLGAAAKFMGVGIYYAATATEARLCRDKEVIVVGGGNSAGQAAIFLASNCSNVHMLVRSRGLAESMSNYLVRRITDTPNIHLHLGTQIASLDGAAHLESVTWRTPGSSNDESHPIEHVFLMTGALPATQWLDCCVALNEKSFIRTGMDLTPEDLPRERWHHRRAPESFETNVPGIFAVGDVRCGSVKRVAAAVGEGSACVQQVHKALSDGL